MSEFPEISREILPEVFADLAIVRRAELDYLEAEERRFRHDVGLLPWEEPLEGTPEYETLWREWEIEQAYRIREQEK